MTTPTTLRLTERDLALICTAHTFGGVTIDQLRRLHFPGGHSHTPCYERVARLVAAEYLASIGHLPVPGGVGSGKRVLAAGPSARPVLAARLGLTGAELARLRRPATPTFLGHHVAINEVRLAVTLATRAASPRLTLVEWIGDRALHRQPLTGETTVTPDPARPKRVVGVVPDSAFTLALADGSRHRFWLEVDLGTVAEPRLRTKLRHYLTLDAGTTTGPVPVLFVTPTAERLRTLRAWLAAEAAEEVDPSRVWFALSGQLTPEALFTRRLLYLGTRERPVALGEIEPFAAAWRALPPAATPATPRLVAPGGQR